ncbi:MAG: isopentenyl-diphosphate Delta-isomerase [Flavobacteriales bacterium]
MDKVILVNDSDKELGTMEKLQAHELGLLHRAFSLFIFNTNNELLIHKRATTKYHSGGLWTNSCCSHPRPNESTENAVIRRCFEELGMKIHSVSHLGYIKYKANLENGLIEHEYDHIYKSISDESPKLNLDEASEYEYRSIESIKSEMQTNPDVFTYWFRKILLEGDYF